VSGYVIALNGCSVSWKSQVQKTVALSSAEAEYAALCEAAREIIFLRNLLSELGFEQRSPTLVHQDNQACVSMATSAAGTSRSRHVALRLAFVRDAVRGGLIAVKYCPTADMVAGVLTKTLPKTEHTRLRLRLMNGA
jgi:hypothetical protein